MRKVFWISFRLRMTYRINSILYAIRQVPGLKRILPVSLYGKTGLKMVFTVLALLWEIVSIFINKGLYVAICIYCPVVLMASKQPSLAIIHILFFLSIAGAISNNTMFDPTKDKYYAMISLRMDAKAYTLTDYTYSMIKILVGMGASLLVVCLWYPIPWYYCLVVPFYIIAAKTISAAWSLYRFETKKILRNENSPVKLIWTLILTFWVLAYGALFAGFFLPEIAYLVLMVMVIVIGIGVCPYVLRFQRFREMYRLLLQKGPVQIKASMKEVQNKNSWDMISQDQKITSQKTGYAYFNDLFIKRHKRILWRSSKRMTLICLGIVVFTGILEVFLAEAREVVQGFVLNYLPYFVFILYSFNSSKSVVQAMFRNCDHSMLTYSFYRRPDVILSLFRLRLRSLIVINLMPALVLAIGLPILLAISQADESIWVYPIVFICIVSTSIFFSIHYLTSYYLLQPYNEFTETKSATYGIVMSLTYIVCFAFICIHMSTYVFGTIMSLFCILYILIAYKLVYAKAPKTFRLRR